MPISHYHKSQFMLFITSELEIVLHQAMWSNKSTRHYNNRYPNQNFKLISGDKKHKQNAYTTVYIGSAGFAVYK